MNTNANVRSTNFNKINYTTVHRLRIYWHKLHRTHNCQLSSQSQGYHFSGTRKFMDTCLICVFPTRWFLSMRSLTGKCFQQLQK